MEASRQKTRDTRRRCLPAHSFVCESSKPVFEAIVAAYLLRFVFFLHIHRHETFCQVFNTHTRNAGECRCCHNTSLILLPPPFFVRKDLTSEKGFKAITKRVSRVGSMEICVNFYAFRNRLVMHLPLDAHKKCIMPAIPNGNYTA